MTLNGPEKTALLLLLLEEPEAAKLLARLDPAEVEAIGRAMLSVAQASPATIDSLLDEVLELAGETVALGDGSPTVRDLFGRALGEDRAGGMIERLGDEARPPLFERLQWLEPFAIAALLEGEHPQAQALVLAKLSSARAADVLAQLPPASQSDLLRRIATLRAVSPNAAEALDAALAERIQSSRPRQPLTGLGGMQRAADLINMAGLSEDVALKALQSVDPEAAEKLSETLFTFDDLQRIDARGLQTLMRSVEADILVPALRAAPEAMRDLLLGAMPQRAAEAMRDEMDSRGPVRMDEAREAQKAMAAAARKLAADGEIVLPGQGPAFV